MSLSICKVKDKNAQKLAQSEQKSHPPNENGTLLKRSSNEVCHLMGTK